MLKIPMTIDGQKKWETRLNSMAVLRHLGAAVELGDQYKVKIALVEKKIEHIGGMGEDAINGAIISGMMDCAMSIAGILHFHGKTCGTLQLSIQFIKPVRFVDPVIECWAIRKSTNLVFLGAHLLDSFNRSCVAATGIVGLSSSAIVKDGKKGNNWLDPVGLVDVA